MAARKKASLGLKQCRTAKKIKPVALAIVKLRKFKGIRQLGSHSVENSID